MEYTGKFVTAKALKEKITDICETFTQMGYILPGHGLKGKQYFITTDADVADMYVAFKGKSDILLWCWHSSKNESTTSVVIDEVSGTASRSSESGPNKASKKDSIAKKITKVEEIVHTLQNIHGERYSVEQLNSWAHMIELKKHESYDMPPDLPYFRKRRRQAEQNVLLEKEPQSHTNLSPCKLRSECIDQLNKWHDLLEKVGISKEQYEKLQKTIMEDML